jgi:hypothetical protein
MAKINLVKISRPSICEKTSYLMRTDSGAAETELENLLEMNDVGDSIMFEVVEMDEQEFEELPEFEGW